MSSDDDDIPLAAISSNGGKTKRRTQPGTKSKMKALMVSDGDYDDEDYDESGDVVMKSSRKNKTTTKKTKTTLTTKKRKRENSKPDHVTSSSKPKKTKKTATAPVKKELKKLEKAERLQYAMQSFLWWNAKEPPAGCQWEKMEHAGVSFPEPYKPHGVKMKYDGKPVDLNSVQEEA